MEKTLILIKPDGVKKGIIGKVIDRFEQKGLVLSQMKLETISRATAEEHYGEHKERPFFAGLVDFITSGPSVCMVWEGVNAVQITRLMIGKTNPAEAAPGTIRGDFAMTIDSNIVHGSDSPESAAREIGIFFGK